MSKSVIKLQLTRDLDDGGTVSEQVIIKKMKFRHFNRVLNIVTGIADIVADSPDLQELISELFQSEPFDKDQYPDATPEELEAHELEYKTQRERRFMASMVGSFRVLLGHLPDQMLELLAAVAAIDLDLMLDQEIEAGFDVLDAVLEVNNMEELYERGKLSLQTGKKAFAWISKPKKADENNQEKQKLIPLQ